MNPASGRTILEGAYAHFAEARDTIGQALSAAAVIDSYFVDWGGFTAIDPWIDALKKGSRNALCSLLPRPSCAPGQAC